jgi:hypothetical protein
MCPAPGISQPNAGARIDMALTVPEGTAFVFSAEEFTIQMVTISR